MYKKNATKENQISQAKHDIQCLRKDIEQEYDDIEKAQRKAFSKINEYKDRIEYLKRTLDDQNCDF